MSERPVEVTWDGNEAAADVAYRASEAVAIYPITPASPMGEHADAWAAKGRFNLWGDTPRVIEMQSEGGAAGAVHGALQGGALTTTFTASQGLLLMIPNLYKIAGELTPAVLHVAARTIATHALSIFGDHSDIYAVRQTGVALLAGGSVQEAHDLAAVAHAATLTCRVPFVHFFDGFRTSHEIARIARIPDEALLELFDADAIQAHRDRALTPDHPVVRGTAQNPDAFFQAREACNPFYDVCAEHVQAAMDRFAALTGRAYHLFDYVGHPEAERVVICMGSAAETIHETVDWLVARGEKVGLVKVRLYRPFDASALLAALPRTTTKIAVLDRTKEPGAPAEPLHLDVVFALSAARGTKAALPRDPVVVGGRYGLSGKELTPAMIVALYGELGADRPRDHFTLGIVDDVTHLSLPWDQDLDIEPDEVVRCLFYGLGSDGTVGANKNSIRILGEGTDLFTQGYFVYDSKKSGAVTVSHLRFGPRPIRSTYLVGHASFVGVHQWTFLDRFDVLEKAADGAVLLVNSPYGPDAVWAQLPRELQQGLIDRRMSLWVIDAYEVAREAGLGRRINTVMQTCFFAISGVLSRDKALEFIKDAARRTYGKKGDDVVQQNIAAIDRTLQALHEVPLPAAASATRTRPPVVPARAPDFVQRVTSVLMEGKGDLLPVSAFPPDGTWPVGTSRWEKRSIAQTLPIWDETLCIQCNKCALVCPHAAIRVKAYEPELLDGAPEGFRSAEGRGDLKGQRYTVQLAPDDCTGCTLCSRICPAKDKSNPRHRALDMLPALDHRDAEAPSWDFFRELPDYDRRKVRLRVQDTQLFRPLFEFSGACAGCGETPYIKLLTQLFGDRALIANATGCSSIYGGNLPTTPYCADDAGRGPAWSNSLFEDNAEFGLGFRLAVDQVSARAQRLLRSFAGRLGDERVSALLEADQSNEEGIAAQRDRVVALRAALASEDTAAARELSELADYLVRKSVWIVGGDGWAYDIGYGGLDHALASGLDVNILVLDTEVYSNTGGQQSKATPMGAVAKFAASGKAVPKKDLGMAAMAYGEVYVAQVALGAKEPQTFSAFIEAESWPGPSLIVAYSPCIAHGYDLSAALDQQDAAVKSGYWPLYRYDPRRRNEGAPPLKLDSRKPKLALEEFAWKETRFRMLLRSDPARAKELMERAQQGVDERFQRYEELSRLGGDKA